MALSEQEELELLTLEREKAFSSTAGGAATGNPNLRRQGDKQVRAFGGLEPLVDIGGAGAVGGALGAFSSELATAAGNSIGALPYPVARTAGNFLKATGDILKAGGRAAPTIAGALSGAASETAGQVAEGMGAGPGTAEAARLIGGAAGPEPLNLGIEVLRKYAAVPALGLVSKFKHEAVKTILQKVDSGGFESLNDQEKALFTRLTGELRGAPKTDEPLEKVGTGMAQTAEADVSRAGRALEQANKEPLWGIGRPMPVPEAEMADTGGNLRGAIVKKNSALKSAMDAKYAENEAARDAVVAANEAAGKFINKTPEFESLVNDLKRNLESGKRSPDVQGTYKYILSQIESGGKDAFGQPKPISFQVLDDVRRNLGEVFRGKPPEGYAAIGAEDARRYYAMISDAQKKYAGEKQAQLLDDYARGKEGLEPFISAKGRKATALDRYDDKQFATDASKLPDAYFNTRAGVQALKSLTGNDALVNRSAMEYINKKLDGASSAQVDAFMRKNSEWLKEFPLAMKLVENHGAKLVAKERGVAQATQFANEAASNQSAILGGRYPADRVRNLVQNGNMDLWEKAGPAIAASTEAKANVLSAVRQVLADKPVSPDQFSRQIRPALKGAGLADDAALDLIQSKLQAIKEMKIPEAEKLGLYRRIALQTMGGYTASAMARGAVEFAKRVPD